jgi:membrane protein YqaA with SNARE-associated domain
VWIAHRSGQPWLIAPLALAACIDSLVPILPAEVFAFALMVLQPQHRWRIAAGFAAAAATSALLLASVLNGALVGLGISVPSAELLSAKPGAPSGDFTSTGPGDLVAQSVDRAHSLLREAGLPALAVLATLSIFPDTPRASVALATLLRVPAGDIFAAVLAGKTLLYLAMLVATEALLPLRARRDPPRWLRRPQALHRWLVREQRRGAGRLRDR